MVIFHCHRGWDIWWLFSLASYSKNQDSCFLSLPTPTVLSFFMWCWELNLGSHTLPTLQILIISEVAVHPVEAEFHYRIFPCCLGDLIWHFQLLFFCVVPLVWQDLHECHLSPGPHPAQACRHGRSGWVQASAGNCWARIWWVGPMHTNLLLEPLRDPTWRPVPSCLCRGQEAVDR